MFAGDLFQFITPEQINWFTGCFNNGHSYQKTKISYF